MNNNEQFLNREPFVLLTIICISSLTRTPMENVGIPINPGQELKLWIRHIVIPVPAIIVVAVLSHILGRKFAFKVLCGLITISSLLKSFPLLANSANVMQSIITGGVLATSSLAIAEYCTPKHRLAYQIANTVARETFGESTGYIVGKWLPVFEVGMGLLCLGSVFTWPEAPYWLVARGRHGEVRPALLWLRKEGISARSELQYLERMPRPLPRTTCVHYWETLFPFTAVCLSQLSYYYQYAIMRDMNYTIPSYLITIQKCTTIVVLSLMIVISYNTKRNVLYFILTFISTVSCILIGFWLCLCQKQNVVIILLYFCRILYCELYVIINAIYIEFIPLQFNTQVSCIYAIILKISPLALWRIYLTGNLVSIGLNTSFVMPLSLLGAFILYKFSPVTHNKNLLEIVHETSALAHDNAWRDATRENPTSIELARCERESDRW